MQGRQPASWLVLVGAVLGAVLAVAWPITPPSSAAGFSTYAAQLCLASIAGAVGLLAFHRVRLKIHSGDAVLPPRLTDRTLLILSAVPALVFLLALLGAWPGHLSSDSVSHWYYSERWMLGEPLGAAYTLLISMLGTVWRSPAAVVIFQILCFLALTYAWLRVMRSFGVPRWVVVTFVAFLSLWPGHVFMAMSLWKDVPYSLSLWGLSMVILLLVRAAGEPGREHDLRLVIAYGVLLTAAMLWRLNGMPTGVLVAAALPLLLWGTRIARGVALAGGAAVLLAVAFRTVVLPHVGHPAPTYLNSWHAWHVIGSYVKAGTSLAPQDQALLGSIVPLDKVASQHDCVDAGPIIHALPLNYEVMGRRVSEINELGLRLIFADPLIFVRHQLCVSALIWRLSDRPERHIHLPHFRDDTPDEAYRTLVRELGVEPAPLVPTITDLLRKVHDYTVSEGRRGLFWRPAWWLYAALACVCYLAVVTRNPRYAALALVPLAHSIVLATTILSPDFRYQYGVVLIGSSMLAVVFGHVAMREVSANT